MHSNKISGVDLVYKEGGKEILGFNFSLSYWPRRLVYAMRAPCVDWPLLSPLFSLSLFLFLRFLLLTHFGESPMCKTRRYMQKNGGGCKF